MGDFEKPKGNPDTLRDVARLASAKAETFGSTRATSVTNTQTAATTALPRLRRPDYTAASGDVSQGVHAVAMSLGSISGSLSTYAGALETAQTIVGNQKTKYDNAHSRWLVAHHAGETATAEAERKHMTDARDRAADAKTDLKSTEGQILMALTSEVEIWAPKATSPAAAWAAAANGILPTEVELDRNGLETAYADLKLAKDMIMKAKKAAVSGWQAWQILGYLRAPSTAAKAERAYMQANTTYQLLKGLAAKSPHNPAIELAYWKAGKDWAKAYQKLYPADALKAQKHFGWLRGMLGDAKALEKLTRQYPNLTVPEIMGKAGRFEKFLKPIRAISPLLNKVMGPVAIVTGGLDVYTALTDESMATDDRIARGVGGTATMVGGVTTVLVVAGLVSNPVGWGIIITTGVIAVGAWAYENWDKVEKGVEWVGDKLDEGKDAVVDKAKDIGGGIKDMASSAWNGVFG